MADPASCGVLSLAPRFGRIAIVHSSSYLTRSPSHARRSGAECGVLCHRDAPGDLIVWEIRGRVTAGQLRQALEESLSLGLAEYMLWNALDGDLTGLALDAIEGLVGEILEGPWAPRRWAILVRGGASLGAGAMLEFAAAERGAGERVWALTDGPSAVDWLRAAREARAVGGAKRPQR
jgi:hypothetical protein